MDKKKTTTLIYLKELKDEIIYKKIVYPKNKTTFVNSRNYEEKVDKGIYINPNVCTIKMKQRQNHSKIKTIF